MVVVCCVTVSRPKFVGTGDELAPIFADKFMFVKLRCTPVVVGGSGVVATGSSSLRRCIVEFAVGDTVGNVSA